MDKLIKSSSYVISQLAYEKDKYQGEKTAVAAKETLLSEIIEAREKLKLFNNEKEFIDRYLFYLEQSLNNIETKYSYNERPLNYILAEYCAQIIANKINIQ